MKKIIFTLGFITLLVTGCSTTQTTSEIFTVENNKVTVNSENITFNFTDNFEVTDESIKFGPETVIPESPTDKKYTRPAFSLKLVPQRSYNEIQKNQSTTSSFTQVKVNQFDVIKWKDSSFCDTQYYEIIGVGQNIQLKDQSCNQVNSNDYFEELLNNTNI